MIEALTIKGVWGATYDLPISPQDVQAHVCVTKKDGQKFYLPVADVCAIAGIIEAQMTLINRVAVAKAKGQRP